MIPLSTYLRDYQDKIDGHSHFFDFEKVIGDVYTYPSDYKRVVGFADIRFDKLDNYKNGKMVKLYDDYITNHYNPKTQILLATAYDIEDAITIYKKYPNIIKGFGEFKCYRTYFGKPTGIKDLSFLEPLCNFDTEYNLPIYIHWNMLNDSDYEEYVRLISKYPSIPFVICHFGMGYDKPNIPDESVFDKSYEYCVKLYENFTNTYFDISYRALNYFHKHPKLLNVFAERLIIGSDINPQAMNLMPDKYMLYIKKTYREMNDLYQYRFTSCIKTLFPD